MASTDSLAGYKVGEISQALLTKDRKAKTVKNENVQLNALFSSANLFQPQFVSVTSKVRTVVKFTIMGFFPQMPQN